MYLQRILGSKTKINVLASLVSNLEELYVEKDLARECGASLSEVNRQMPDLVDSGLVIMQRMAKVKVYRINTEHFLFAPLEKLFKDLVLIYKEIADQIVNFIIERHKIEAVILLGSLRKESLKEDIVKEPSDIDLLFVVEEKKDVEKDLIGFINKEISMKYGIVVYPMVLSKKEYIVGLEDSSLVIEAHSHGELMYGEKPRRFV
ncbi:winged helix-turn-helix transcriptional regulator [Candidatus Pacearchaeota archaeon]|nr:winged helix-turn-helix transcriptional regulator [Candidatus Pacearchaeota archaeon]